MAVNNRQVNCWRGSDPPPTIHHIWIKDEHHVLLYNGLDWVEYVSATSTAKINVTEELGNVIIEINDSAFTISSEGSSIGLRKGSDNTVIISSNALNTINTEAPLQWNGQKLTHLSSGVEAGAYGQSVSSDNANTFKIPSIEVSATGHITKAQTTQVTIRDYVGQNAVSATDTNAYPIILASSANSKNETNEVQKTSKVTFDGSTLSIQGGVAATGDINADGDLVVKGVIIGQLQGNVTGTATPKIHLSEQPDYGGASTNLYGHVKLQDELGVSAPNPSSTNADTSKGVEAIAASPLMVWNALQEAKNYVDDNQFTVNGVNAASEPITIKNNLSLTDDFVVNDENKLEIQFMEI